MATVAVIGALQLFDQAVIAGGVNGDPNNALMTMVLYLYNQAFKQFDFGMAAAVGRHPVRADLRGDAGPAPAVRAGPRHGEDRAMTAPAKADGAAGARRSMRARRAAGRDGGDGSPTRS